jgi:hypothetical protein
MAEFRDAPSLPPLPAELTPEVEEPDQDDTSSTTVEATLGHNAGLKLETQPSEKLKLFLEIGNTLTKTLELDRLMPQIVDSLFHLFKQADRCFIILAEDTTTRTGEVSIKLIPKVVKTRRPHDETNARFSKTIVKNCLQTADAFLSDDALGGLPLSQSVVDFRIRSVMCVPLCDAEGKAFGVIQLDTQDRNKKFTQEDLRLLKGVANQASVALQNAKLHEDTMERERYQREMALAHQVQMSFLPQSLPEVTGYEFYAHYESALEVGGDYYGFIPISPSLLAILLGDVAGKGMPAALLMARLSADARFCLLTEKDASKAITKLNDLLYQYTSRMDRFVTLMVAVLDLKENSVTLLNAGHLTPMVFQSSNRNLIEAMPNEVAGIPLGIQENQVYRTWQVALKPGDSLLLYTDGVCDALNVPTSGLK